jgi:hypothetical protein
LVQKRQGSHDQKRTADAGLVAHGHLLEGRKEGRKEGIMKEGREEGRIKGRKK